MKKPSPGLAKGGQEQVSLLFFHPQIPHLKNSHITTGRAQEDWAGRAASCVGGVCAILVVTLRILPWKVLHVLGTGGTRALAGTGHLTHWWYNL